MGESTIRQHFRDNHLGDYIGIPIIFICPQGNIRYANKLAARLFGLEGLKSQPPRRCCDTLKMDICREKCPSSRLSRSGEVVYDYFVHCQSLESAYCVSTCRITGSSGENLGVVHSFKDMELVTRILEEHKQTRRELELSQLKMQAILESMADGIFTADIHGRINHFSKSMQRMTGYGEKDVVGKTCCAVLKGELCRSDCPIHCSVKTGQRVEKCQETIRTRDSRALPVSITISPIKKQGVTTGIVVSVQDRTEIEKLRRELDTVRGESDMVGSSSAMLKLYTLLRSVAGTDVTVLIEGETGTGKELVARAIYRNSERSDGPFVTVNCSALPFSLLESELFGHVRGAFSGAVSDKKGKFEVAEGGVLFLDEISEIDEATQLKLLRFLQSWEIERVGDTRTKQIDVRVVAATNRRLKDMVRKGRFREDLYYRLNVFPVRISPLRKRREDIPQLVEHFIRKHQLVNPRIDGISTGALERLVEYGWPGNVRELENSVMYAMASGSGRRIQKSDLPSYVGTDKSESVSEVRRGETQAVTPAEIEKRRIIRAFREHNWKVDETAESLGYSRTTLWRRTKKFGISLPNREGNPETAPPSPEP